MIMGARGLGQVPTGAASGGVTGVPQLSNEQWYELIALASNQPLAQVQSLYSQTAPSGTPESWQTSVPTFTNLQIAIGQWPGGIAHSGWAMYQQGAIVDAPAGGHYYKYGPTGGSWASTGAVNQWAIPSQAVQAAAPTNSTVQQQTTSSVQAEPIGGYFSAGNATTTTGNFLTGTLVDNIPNWMLLGGGALALFLVMQMSGRR